MRLFELLQQQIAPQRIASLIVESVSQSNGRSITPTVRDFLHSVSDAIGLNYYVTLSEVTNSDYHWPREAVSSFRFQCDESIFVKYGTLLARTCKVMDAAGHLERLLHIVEAFFKFCDSMHQSWEDPFWEPLSLISVSLLKGMHKIRKVKSDSCPLLNGTCHKLFEFAQKGLGHQDSHDVIFTDLCVLLELDYDYFWYFDGDVFKFFVKAMEYEISVSRTQLFTHMRLAVENSRVDSGPKEGLIRFLTEPDIIKAYCVFAEKSSTNLLSSLLRFLQTLLRHLNILECFSREQIHTIFRNGLSRKPKIRALAIDFYLTYMQRCFSEKLILTDIIDFYLSHTDSITNLDDFIESLWDKFPYLTHFDSYLRFLMKPEWSVKTLSVTAQFAVRVYRKLYQEAEGNDDYAQRLSGCLLKLPNVLNSLKDKWQIVGILLQCYSITEPDVAIVTIKDFPIAADYFVKYAIGFLKKPDKDYTVVRNMTHIMLDLMEALNMQDDMDNFGHRAYKEYREITSKQSMLSLKDVKRLQHTLALLAASTDSLQVLNEEHVFELVSDLRSRLIESRNLQELSEKHGCILDTLAITTYSGCLNILSIMYAKMTSDESHVVSTVLLNQIHPFHEYLLATLGGDDHAKLSLAFAEAAIRALCDLYIIFNFRLERAAFHVLVNSVEAHVFTAPPAGDPLRQLELEQNILQCFNMLHKMVEIPTAITWKIVAYFGVSPSLVKELTELLDILFEYNSEKFPKPKLFNYVIPVAMYNLFRRTQMYKFNKAMNAFKRYVETRLPDRTQRVMKLHVVLTIIDMIDKAMQVGDVSQQRNRMNLLSNMHIFLTDVYKTEANLILTQSRRLQTHPLTREERGTLSEFQERLSS